MSGRIGKHFLITGILVLLCTLLLLIPDPVLRYTKLLLPVLFFTVLSGTLSGPFFAVLTGTLPPLFCFLLLHRTPFLPDVMAEMLCLASSGILAGVFTRVYQAPGAGTVLGVLAGRIVFGITMMIYEFVIRDSYTLMQYLQDAYLSCWPGLLLAMFAVPAVFAVLRRTGVVKKLQNEHYRIY